MVALALSAIMSVALGRGAPALDGPWLEAQALQVAAHGLSA